MDIQVKDLMQREVMTLNVSNHLDVAKFVMEWAHIRHLPVMEDGHLVGLISRSDLFAAGMSTILNLSDDYQKLLRKRIKVEDIMERDVVCVKPSTSAEETVRLMRDRKIGCVVVLEGEEVVGILTVTDILDVCIKILDG